VGAMRGKKTPRRVRTEAAGGGELLFQFRRFQTFHTKEGFPASLESPQFRKEKTKKKKVVLRGLQLPSGGPGLKENPLHKKATPREGKGSDDRSSGFTTAKNAFSERPKSQ